MESQRPLEPCLPWSFVWGPHTDGSWLCLGWKMIKSNLKKVSCQNFNLKIFEQGIWSLVFFLKNQRIWPHHTNFPMWGLWPELIGGHPYGLPTPLQWATVLTIPCGPLDREAQWPLTFIGVAEVLPPSQGRVKSKVKDFLYPCKFQEKWGECIFLCGDGNIPTSLDESVSEIPTDITLLCTQPRSHKVVFESPCL